MAEGGQKPHEVMKFMDVYQRSFCRPIETLVDIFQEYPDEIEFIFKPSCVPLMRCGGCCNDESLECVPTEEFNITMQIMRIKPHQSQHIGEMSFLQHNKCECRPKKDKARQEKKSVRGKGKGQKRKRKKSRYKSWSAYVVPLPSHSPHRSLPGPQSYSHLQDPRAAHPSPVSFSSSQPPSSQCLSLTLTPLIGTEGSLWALLRAEKAFVCTRSADV
ncbi:vascular endothelial growth factor A isoform X2 [Oryx dammah]|nr:vascular endothelial growth factor A isoform X2 [Oryx dammah]